MCRSCLPAIQERIKQKEHFARSQAFGGWLETNRSGQRPALSRVSSITKGDREKPWEIWLWRVQGALYVLNTVWTVVSYLAGWLDYSHFVSATNSTVQACEAEVRGSCTLLRQLWCYLASCGYFLIVLLQRSASPKEKESSCESRVERDS